MKKLPRALVAVLAVGLLSAVPSVAPVGHGAGSPAFAATVGSGSCSQTVSSATYVTVASSGADCIITFSGTTTDSDMSVDWTVPYGINEVDLLLVGGGGSGGSDEGGGGGAGLFIEKSDFNFSSDVDSEGEISIQVGAGGSFNGGDYSSDTGGNSSFGSLTAVGGGTGGYALQADQPGSTADDGGDGGSGGGGAGEDIGGVAYQGPGGSAVNSSGSLPSAAAGEFGNDGGDGWSGGRGGGGGGAGATGANGSSTGNGGTGKQSSITGSAVWYAAGGGGGRGNTSSIGAGAGGSGIGGNGGDDDDAAQDGSDGTGSGGGGAGGSSSSFAAGDGGDGIVVVRYTLPASPTVSSSPSDQSVNANQTASFSASASTSDGGTLSYQWQLSTNSGSSWSSITGATASSYTTGALDATDSGNQFRVRVKNTLGLSFSENDSSAATVTVSRIAQTVTWSPPSSQTAVDLGDSGFTITAATTDGDGSISYSPTTETGDTSCKINSSSRVVTFASAGTCTLTATAAQSDIYNSATQSVVITVSVGTFAISGPSSKVGTSSSAFTDVCASSCDVSGFAAADEVLVVVSKSGGGALSGRVRLGSTTGLTQSLDGYQSDATASGGFLELGFEGTQAEVNAALETLQYESPSGGGDETLAISASLAGAAYFSGTGHYYEAITSPTETWEAARDAAAASSFNGLTGYLVTITSDAENTFVKEKTGVNTWIGASDNYLEVNAVSDESFVDQDEAEGTWYWVTGPEAGTQFWAGAEDGSAVDGEYQNWSPGGEPNDYPNDGASGEEDYGHLIGASGLWNDFPETQSIAYVIEYGGAGGTALKEASTTFDVGAPTAPLQVTGASATAGNNQVALSWSAPDSGGSAITDYVIEQLDSDGSTWNTLTDGVSTSTSFTVTGLTNGTSYSFRVSAKNTIGTGTVSSTVSATPAVPAPSGGGSSGGTIVTPAPVVAPTTPAQPRIITPTQPTSRPGVLLGPVSSPGRGFDPNVGTRATVGGAPATVVKRAVPGGFSVQTGAFQFGVSLGGNEENTVDDGVSDLGVAGGGTAKVTGSGMLPGSPVQVWLPGPTGTESRELARATVNEDGQVEADLAFVAKPSDTAIAIGPQVMQVTGYDDDGNLTVVDMTINVAQGPIAPEPDRSEGALPALSVGSSLATSAGIPTPVTVVPLSEEKRVSIGDGSWTLLVDVDPETGVVGGTPGAPVVQVTQDSVGSASGEGFMPGTTASVWMFSDPTLLGTVTVGEDGSFTAEFQMDSTYLPVGTHTLQVQGVGDDGYIKAANLGVDVQAPADLTSTGSSGLLWWVAGIFTVLLAVVFLIIMFQRRRSGRPAN